MTRQLTMVSRPMQLLNLTWGAGASVAAGIVLEKLKIESKPIQVRCNAITAASFTSSEQLNASC